MRLFSMQQLFYLKIDLKNHSYNFRKYSSSMTTMHSVYLVYIFMIPMKFVLVSLSINLTILNKIFGK